MLLYCYPEEIYDELIQTMKEEPKVCHYLDLPIQHANDTDLEDEWDAARRRQSLRISLQSFEKEIPDIVSSYHADHRFPGGDGRSSMRN